MIKTLDTTTLLVRSDMSNDEYHGEKTHVSRSEAYRYRGILGGRAQQWIDRGKGSLFSGNSSTDFGTLVDVAFSAVCEGRKFESAVVCPPPDVLGAGGRRAGKAYQEWRSALPPSAIECREDDLGKVRDILDSIMEHTVARRLIEGTVSTQESVFWTDAEGHQRKARADGVTCSHWYDLKTTSKEWHELRYSFLRFGYHWQSAWYQEAAALSGRENPHRFPFIVVQVFAPYDVQVINLDQHTVNRARDEIRETLNLIRDRRITGDYVDRSYYDEVELALF